MERRSHAPHRGGRGLAHRLAVAGVVDDDEERGRWRSRLAFANPVDAAACVHRAIFVLRGLAPALLITACMTTHHLLSAVLLPAFLTLAGACASGGSATLFAFTDVGPAGMGPMFVGGQCFSRTLPLASEGAACAVVEARHADGECRCDESAARRPIAPEHENILSKIEDTARAEAEGWNCFCEIAQLDGAAAAACQTQASPDVEAEGAPVDGFCYLDATTSPPIGDPAVMAPCPEDSKRFVRFVGKATQGSPGARTTRITACETVVE